MLLFVAGVVFLGVFWVTHTRDTDQDHAYFGGDVAVHYHHTGFLPGFGDYVSFTFEKPGEYQVWFALPPGNKYDFQNIPESFTVNVSNAPTTKVVQQNTLPTQLRVTIQYNGSAEYHDFSQ